MSDIYNLLNSFNFKIKSNHVLGAWMQIPSIIIADIISNKKFDFVTLDMEHGSIFLEHIQDLSQVIKNNNSIPLVRVNKPDVSIAKKALEQGAGGIILPMIESVKQFEEIAKHLIYPPKGQRSIGFSKSNNYGKNLSKEIKKFKPFIVCMIENINLYNELDHLLSSKYLSAILIGPYDLSSALGICGDFTNIKFKNVIKNIRSKAKIRKIPCGAHIVNPNLNELKLAIKNGDKFIPFSLDTVLLDNSLKNFE